MHGLETRKLSGLKHEHTNHRAMPKKERDGRTQSRIKFEMP
jgi:hypothetical protein